MLTAAALSLPLLSGCVDMASEKRADGLARHAQAMTDPSPLGHYLSARVARDEMDSNRAASFYDIALAASPENQPLLHQTMVLMLAEGRMQRALELAQSRITHKDDAAMARLILAVDAIRGGDLETARRHLNKASRKNYMSLLQPMLMAWVEAASNEYGNAIKTLEQLRGRAAFEPFRSYHTALVSDFAGYEEAASAAYRETMKSEARRVTRVTLNYGGFLSRSGKNEQALALFGSFLKRLPTNPVIRHANDQLLQGKKLWPPMTSVAHGVAEAFLSAGFAIANARGGETARIYAHMALFLRPDLDAARMLLAEILENVERYEEAISVYRQVPEASPFHWNARIRTAANMNSLDRIDETVALLDGMAKERPKDTSALITAARILRSQERFEEAIAAYSEVLRRLGTVERRHWSLLYERGIALERSKQWKAAEADFLRALEFRPNEASVLNYLGYSWIDQGINLDRARKMIEKAVSKRPNDGYVVDSLGWAFFRLGKYAKAVEHLERAVELRPQDPIINDHLGDAYWRAGRKLEARFQWSHAIDLGAEEELLPVIHAKRDKGLGPPKPLQQETGGKSESSD
ncbi:MAG: tetratricopeptide repeat protein [Alphaproteobacteria bacterium]|nr:tetratricopeptide repeat protein [Alphaproteobacteria bacterium]